MRNLTIGLMAVLCVLSAGAGWAADTAEDNAKGIVRGNSSGGQSVTCTLEVPDVVHSGEVFLFQVNYSPSLCTPKHTETFTFNWPSTTNTFKEQTVRKKVFRHETSCIDGSAEQVLVPSSPFIQGKFEANVTVEGVCSVNAKMKVEFP